MKNLVRKQKVAPASYFQGETGLRGEIGSAGRDGARVSKLFCLFVLRLSPFHLLTSHSVEKLSKIEQTKGFKCSKRVLHAFLDLSLMIFYMFQKKNSAGISPLKIIV